jgi:hypothetical protein
MRTLWELFQIFAAGLAFAGALLLIDLLAISVVGQVIVGLVVFAGIVAFARWAFK